MTNVIRKSTNKFTKGLVMDFSPENTKNELLTNALNATLLTFNGNELSLLNDMGNARVETAYLPEGYIPVGTCEYGGIIYIVSYNPLEDKSLIGCFPSPERNVSSDELGESNKSLQNSDFIDSADSKVIHSTQTVLLKNDKLNPGDKFLIYADPSLYDERLQGLEILNGNKYDLIENPYIALNIVSIEDSGRIVYLDSTVKHYTQLIEKDKEISTYRYTILGKGNSNGIKAQNDVDSYRDVLSSGYSVFKSKTSGKLAILAELIMIDSYSITHEIKETAEGKFDIILHTEVSPTVDETNFPQVPKIAYHFLEESQGYILTKDAGTVEMFEENTLSKTFMGIKLNQCLNATTIESTLEDSCKFDFPNSKTYTESGITSDSMNYKSIKFASIELPEDVHTLPNNPFPFTYNYTLVPCMAYGKLSHLAVSNSINFANLYNFNASGITTWKYRIDENQLRLTIGTEVFDSTSTDFKVDGIILEFYDLWGFAGSLVIDGKASYSGLFTKVINLNSFKVLQNRRVTTDTNGKLKFEGGYLHNINITENSNDKKYYLDDHEVIYNNLTGWNYATENVENEFHDDCGTLYSNILYGVKAYLRKTDNSGNSTYFPIYDDGTNNKKKLFLYTIPFLNEYYYTKDDFTELGDIALDFVLTYKLEDSSTKQPLTSDSGYTNGYNSWESKLVDQYINGNMSDRTDFSATKIYKYEGNSKLYIELGLKEDYSLFGLKYKPEINEHYTCDLKIVSEDPNGNPVFVRSRSNPDLDPDKVVNHNYSSTLELGTINPTGGIRRHNFLEGYSGTPISLTYKLLVGYVITVSDIRAVQIPATTVCALCHKREDGTYNYEDFGIYEYVGDDGKSNYLSQSIFYNEGDINTTITGICRQLYPAVDNTKSRSNFASITSVEEPTVDIKTPGKLNSGNALKLLLSNIGKLSFCQPHLHTLNDAYGVNIYNTYESGSYDVKSLFLGGNMYNSLDKEKIDLALGTIPLIRLAQLNMCANTVNAIKYQSEFISAVPYNKLTITKDSNSEYFYGKPDKIVHILGDNDLYYRDVTTVEFKGFSYGNLFTFNSRLLTTMKSIYAYNPDYDSLTAYKGNVTIIDNQPQFTSNIINLKSELSEELSNINDYVGFGDIIVSNYLTHLHNFSDLPVHDDEGNTINQVALKPNFRYCGTSEKPVIITPLTYNIPYPEELDSEFQVDGSDRIVIKDCDGENTIITGEINKNALYGKVGNSLLQLDVKNYSIGREGELSCSITSLKTKYDIDLTNEDIQLLATSKGLVKTVKLDNDKEVAVTFTLSSYSGLLNYSGHTEGYLVQDTGSSIYIVQPSGLQSGNDTIRCKLYLEVQCDDLEVKYSDPEILFDIMYPTFIMREFPDGIDMTLLDAHTIKWNLCVDSEVVIKDGEQLTYDYRGSSVPYSCNYRKLNDDTFEFYIYEFYNNKEVSMVLLGAGLSDYIIYKCLPKTISITFELTLDQKVSIVHVNRTNNYGKFTNSLYTVSSEYPNTTFRGTSITINDLIYEPNVEGHRLFLRNGLYISNQTVRNKIYYREIGDSDTDSPPNNMPNKVLDTWVYEGNEYKNGLYLFTGPCFEPSNL